MMKNNNIIFIAQYKNKNIRLTEKQWNHIIFRHPIMVNKINQIIETIESPTVIKKQTYGILKFYKHFKSINGYIMVAVKILNDEGFVATSYVTRKIGE